MAAQRDLLVQTIDVSMPEEVRATVGDGLRHVLKRSGYQLCETPHAVIELYALGTSKVATCWIVMPRLERS